jgi:hypothetical protein
MSTANVLTEPLAARLAPARTSLLQIDAAAFRDGFDRRPFLIGHRLAGHPLFELPRLLELAGALPEKHVEYNAGNLAVNVDPTQTPRNGLSVAETIRRIADCKSWLVLKYVEQDPDYRNLLHRCLDEVKAHSEALHPGMQQAEGFIFITSPGSVTPYHMDPEHNFLLQVRGSKRVHLFDPRDPAILSQEELEAFYSGGHRNMVFKEENRARAWVFELESGQGLHFPVTAPHWVQNGPEVSVSFSITFRTPDLERRSIVHRVNAFLRRRGLRPTLPGRSAWKDAVKCFAYRVVRRAKRLVGMRT